MLIETPRGLIHVVNWHLGLAEGERRLQVRHLLSHPCFKESAHLPTVIAGDFNDWRNALSKHCFANAQFQQATAPSRHFRSFPAFMPVASLDKVFYRGLQVRQVRVLHSHLARRASDHLPVVVDFDWH